MQIEISSGGNRLNLAIDRPVNFNFVKGSGYFILNEDGHSGLHLYMGTINNGEIQIDVTDDVSNLKIGSINGYFISNNLVIYLTSWNVEIQTGIKTGQFIL